MGGWRGEADPEPAASSLSPQHFALLLKYLIHVAIPDIPGWVAEEMAKLEYQRREAFKVRGGVDRGFSGGRAWILVARSWAWGEMCR